MEWSESNLKCFYAFELGRQVGRRCFHFSSFFSLPSTHLDTSPKSQPVFRLSIFLSLFETGQLYFNFVLFLSHLTFLLISFSQYNYITFFFLVQLRMPLVFYNLSFFLSVYSFCVCPYVLSIVFSLNIPVLSLSNHNLQH